MGDLSDFQRDQIVGALMAGATVTETAQLFGISRGTVSKLMTAYVKERKTSSAKHKFGCSYIHLKNSVYIGMDKIMKPFKKNFKK